MFYRNVALVTKLARPEGMPLLRGMASQGVDIDAALENMKLSQRLTQPEAWQMRQSSRRQALESLLSEDDASARIMDILCAICEESRWAFHSGDVPFDDEGHPDIDFQAAETAALLGWTVRALGDSLPTRAVNKVIYEVRRRVFSPFLAHEDYPFMRGRGSRPLAILSDIAVSAILLETSEQRKGALLKQATRLIDSAIASRTERTEALVDAAADTAAITDLTVLLRHVTRGQLNLTGDYPTPEWLDQLLYPWLTGPWFCDPAADSMTPNISGAELYRIGRVGKDEALMALGAYLHQSSPTPSQTVTGRLLDGEASPETTAFRLPRLKYAATAHNRIMVSRFNGMVCALHTGGGRHNAGGLSLFCDGEPILLETEDCHNTPLIGLKPQLQLPDLNCEADLSLKDGRDTLSVELTHAWPAGLIKSCQRTAIVQRQEGALRLIDAFDLSEPLPVSFQFFTPSAVEAAEGCLRLGPIEFGWEDQLDLQRAQTPSGTCITLKTPTPVTRAFFTFTFTRATT